MSLYSVCIVSISPRRFARIVDVVLARSDRSIIGSSTSRATLRVPEGFDDTLSEVIGAE